MSRETDLANAASADAEKIVADFVEKHRAAAIPALIGLCVAWAVDHGGRAVIKDSLVHALVLAHDLDKARRGFVS